MPITAPMRLEGIGMADQITISKNTSEIRLDEQFSTLKSTLPGLAQIRATAFDDFTRKGLPNKRVEEFKYTDIRASLTEVASPAKKPDLGAARSVLEAAKAFRSIDAVRLVMIDGYFISELSDIEAIEAGIEVLPLARALEDNHPLLGKIGSLAKAGENPLYQLNSAFMSDGAIIRVGKDVKPGKPLHVAFVSGSEAAATATRLLVIVEEGAELTLVESHEGPDGVASQVNDVVDLIVADGASVDHIRLNAEGRDVLALSTTTARLGAHVAFSSINVVAGSKLARHQIYVAFEGSHSSAQINGTAMLGGRQHADATLVADHIAPNCDSRELFKTVIDGEATGVFQGRINVAAEAQKTDGKMMSACVLLSDTGAMFNKPELEIFADDVQCGHGATCGTLDEDLLFYLMARGLPRAEAESLMLQAFVGEAIEVVKHDDVREELVATVADWLKQRR